VGRSERLVWVAGATPTKTLLWPDRSDPPPPFQATLLISRCRLPDKDDRRMGRNHLKGRDRDHAVLAAASYNFSLLRRWFERLLRALWLIIARAISAPHLA
jgi:hypothetical protein